LSTPGDETDGEAISIRRPRRRVPRISKRPRPSPTRCYYCKHELFAELEPLPRAEGFAVIPYEENASDTGEFRPGAQAVAEFQVVGNLVFAGGLRGVPAERWLHKELDRAEQVSVLNGP
jgi:PP-loop superfamily ATP-utilizing enzyme